MSFSVIGEEAMKRLCITLVALICWLPTFCKGSQAQTRVRLGFPVQIHTANIMLLQEYLKRRGVDLDVAVMRGYPTIQLALTTNELDLAVLGFVNIGLMEEAGFRNSKIIAGVFSGGQSLT